MTAPAAGITPESAPARPRIPRGVVILLSLAAIVVILAGMREMASLIVPVFLALNLLIALHPVGRALERLGLPRVVGSLATMIAVLLALAVFFGTIAWAIGQLLGQLPQYGPQFNALLSGLIEHLSQWGVSQQQIDGWIADFNFSSLLGLLNQAVSSVGTLGGLLAAAIATIVFFGLDAAGLPERLDVIRRVHPAGHHALVDFSRSVRSYWLVTTAFGAVVALIDGLALWALGVPMPAVWAVLLFLCNYIPNIGFIIAMIPPTLMALLDRGPWTALLVVAICVSVAMLLQGLVQPRATGRVVGLAASISFLSVLFWTWVLGALGALLAVPMTLLVKELFIDSDPQSRWMNALLADTPDAAEESPAQRVEDPGEEGDAAPVGTPAGDGAGQGYLAEEG